MRINVHNSLARVRVLSGRDFILNHSFTYMDNRWSHIVDGTHFLRFLVYDRMLRILEGTLDDKDYEEGLDLIDWEGLERRKWEDMGE